MRRFVVLSVTVLALTACASTPPKVQRSEFEDIPVPKGLAVDLNRSTIIESPSVKAARIFYKGRIEPDSLSVAFRTTLEANGWKHLSSTTASDKGTTQVYEKSGSSLQVLIYESWYYTWVEMSATRMVQASAQLKQEFRRHGGGARSGAPPAPSAALDQGVRLGRPPGAGLVVGELARIAAGPAVEHRLQQLPRHRRPSRRARRAWRRPAWRPAAGARRPRAARRRRPCRSRSPSRPGLMRSSGPGQLGAERERHALVGLDAEHEQVRLGHALRVASEEHVRRAA